jgi:hypothetical protein
MEAVAVLSRNAADEAPFFSISEKKWPRFSAALATPANRNVSKEWKLSDRQLHWIDFRRQSSRSMG